MVNKYPIKAVLFDLDGILVNTSHEHYLAWKHIMLKLGHDIEELSILLNEGRSSLQILDILCTENNTILTEIEKTNLLKEKREWYQKNSQPIIYYDAFKVIELLRKKEIKTAIVTGSSKENLEHVLTQELQSYFDVIVTADEGLKNDIKYKPSGDMYFYTRYKLKLGISPESCIAIENSPLGIQAAQEAGMKCVAVETTLSKKYLKEADWIIKKIIYLPELMRKEKLWE
jgi:HAD superfamily hydrolase (TIGR01509 family)